MDSSEKKNKTDLASPTVCWEDRSKTSREVSQEMHEHECILHLSSFQTKSAWHPYHAINTSNIIQPWSRHGSWNLRKELMNIMDVHAKWLMPRPPAPANATWTCDCLRRPTVVGGWARSLLFYCNSASFSMCQLAIRLSKYLSLFVYKDCLQQIHVCGSDWTLKQKAHQNNQTTGRCSETIQTPIYPIRDQRPVHGSWCRYMSFAKENTCHLPTAANSLPCTRKTLGLLESLKRENAFVHQELRSPIFSICAVNVHQACTALQDWLFFMELKHKHLRGKNKTTPRASTLDAWFLCPVFLFRQTTHRLCQSSPSQQANPNNPASLIFLFTWRKNIGNRLILIYPSEPNQNLTCIGWFQMSLSRVSVIHIK